MGEDKGDKDKEKDPKWKSQSEELRKAMKAARAQKTVISAAAASGSGIDIAKMAQRS